jgi:iron complex outermembrane recepter protein
MNLQDVIFKNRKYMRITYLLIGFLFISRVVFAQTADDKEASGSLYKFTVDQDILNLKYEGDATIKIHGASGKEEDVNKTPYSATVLTREEIENAGALTIPEALRLAPGLFVQQSVNGLYEVYMYGTEATSRAGSLSDARSKMVLVMIDNMPVNNYFDGGILWETLPVNLGDVERIEIVRSASNVLFGRDAAAGIINIVTKTQEGNKISVQGTSQYSFSPSAASTAINQASVGFGIRDKFLVRVSGNYNNTRRFDDAYYVFSQERYIPSDSLLFYQSSAAQTNLYGSLARQDYGMNASMRYIPGEHAEVNLSLSHQNSEAQTIYGGFEELALTHRTSTLNFANLNARVHGLNVQASYTFGDQNMAVSYSGYKFDVTKINTRIYYTFNIKHIYIIPGASYQQGAFDDGAYESTDSQYPAIINGNRNLSNYGFFLKVGANLLEDKLTLDGGLRKDFFSFNDQSILSYQAAVAYTAIDRLLLRAAFSQGYTGNTACEAFDESTYTTSQGLTMRNVVNPSLNMSTVQNIELGTRIQATDKILVSADYFRITDKNLIQQSSSFDPDNNTVVLERVNSGKSLQRHGVTASVTASLSGKFKMRAFGTFQKTSYKYDTAGSSGIYTPRYMAGVTGTFRTLVEKLTVSASAYAYGDHSVATTRGSASLPSRIIPNMKVSYKFWQESTVFVNARNFLNSSDKEYIFADDVQAIYLLGVNLNF